MPTVFLDANVLQISVTHRPSREAKEVEWGGQTHTWTADVLAPYEPNTEWLRDQAAALPIIAASAQKGRIRLCTGPEIRHETWFLRHGKLAWTQLSVFQRAAIALATPPFYLDRTFLSYDDQPGDAAQRLAVALSRGDDERFNALKKAVGGNKDADAYHLRCAEHAKADYFLTVDKRLKNSLANQTMVTLSTTVLFPTELAELLAREA